MLDIANMVDDDEFPLVYRRLMAVKPDGLSLNAWANAAEIHRSMFNAIRRHGNPTSATIEKLLNAIGVSWAQYEAADPDSASVRSEVRSGGLSVRDVERAYRGVPQAKPVPLVGSALGGDWGASELGDGVELTELTMHEVFDYLARPPGVEHDPTAYAVTIVGDSMAPRYEAGERAIVSPRATVVPGDDVIVQLRGDRTDRITEVLIKRLVKRTASFVELRQFNPEVSFRVPTERVVAIHKIPKRI